MVSPKAASIVLVLLLRTAAAYLPSPNGRLSVSNTLLLSSRSDRNEAGSRPLTAAQQERRAEDRRRLERKDEVVPGKTSALKDAKDFEIDPKATEKEWLRQASALEREVFQTTDHGIEMLKMMRIDEADEAFNKVYDLKPGAYLWQAGIVKFYKGLYMEAAEVFVKNAAAFEQKFGDVASEERMWRDACELKLIYSLSRKERKRAEGETKEYIPQCGEISKDLPKENRRVMRAATGLFASALRQDRVNELLSRARLLSMCSRSDSRKTMDQKMWKISAWYYLGLYYDVTKRDEKSKDCMKMALRLCPGSHLSSDIIHSLPLLHMSTRDWFGDEEFEDLPEDTAGDGGKESTLPHLNPLSIETIEEGINNMKTNELTEAMRQIGKKVTGDKEELQRRLHSYLIETLEAESKMNM